MNRKFVFNGKEYSSYEDLPAEARAALDKVMKQFSDTDRNGIPDIFESGAQVIQTTQIDVDENRYTSIEEAPRHVRETVEAAILSVDLKPSQNAKSRFTMFWIFLATLLLMGGLIGTILYFNPKLLKFVPLFQ